MKAKTVREPLFHISKRDDLSTGKRIAIRAIAIVVGLLICATLVASSTTKKSKNFFDVFSSLFLGIFGTERRFWYFMQDVGLLLCVALGLVVAFKMKFWNLGGNGQVLMGCFTTAACMFYWGGTMPDGLLIPIMLVLSVVVGALWAFIPAIFKVFFKTNESLFTLMMNYIAICLIDFFISFWYPKGTGAMAPIDYGNLPAMGAGPFGKTFPMVLVAIIVTTFVWAYLKYTKHGYEISIVGESENTARYASINVKKTVLRTLAISGAICGLVGFMLVSSINHMVSSTMDGNMGFTGIMVAWLGKFDPLFMIMTAAFIIFLTRGMAQVCTDFGFTNAALADIILGIFYFLIIGCEFFISYKIIWNDSAKDFFQKVGNFFTKKKPQTENNEGEVK